MRMPQPLRFDTMFFRLNVTDVRPIDPQRDERIRHIILSQSVRNGSHCRQRFMDKPNRGRQRHAQSSRDLNGIIHGRIP